jgi:predicted RNA-binding protein with PUA-like domain
MEVVSRAYPDPTQFEPKHDHYDAGSKREEPRWLLVDVKFRKKLAKPVLLDELREKETKFKGLRILERGTRLSVTPVTAPHWKAILKLAGEKES